MARSRNATTASTTTCHAPLSASGGGWSSRELASASPCRRTLAGSYSRHRPGRDANSARRREAKPRKAVERLDALGRTLTPESSTSRPSQPGSPSESHPSLLTDRHPPSLPGSLASAATPASHHSESSGKFHFAGYEIGSISPRYGLPLFSSNGRRWIEARTGQVAVFPAFDAHSQHRPLYGDAATAVLLPRAQLPAQEAVEEYLSTYCRHHIWLVFPVVDPVLFRHTIAAAYQPEGQLDASHQAEARICVLSFLCVASIFLPVPGVMPVIIEAYAVQVQSWLPQMFVASSVHFLQICLMQVCALGFRASG